jgi:cholesterol transport system auxiliary component
MPTFEPKSLKWSTLFGWAVVLAIKLGLGLAVLAAMGLFSGCAGVLPEQPQRPAVYDLGEPAPAATTPAGTAPRLTLVLAAVEAPPALEGPAMLYRLAHTQALELKPYALARWSMAPAALVRERAAASLAREHTVLAAGDPLPANAFTLKLELLRFEQVFASDTTSSAQLSLRATLFGTDGAPKAQRSFATSADAGANAAGGAAGMRQALDQSMAQLGVWLREGAK